MESRFDRRELLFQPRGIPPLGTSLSLALQHLVAMIVGCVTPPIIIAGAIGLSQEEQVLLIQASLVMSAVCTFLQLYPIGGPTSTRCWIPTCRPSPPPAAEWRPLPAP